MDDLGITLKIYYKGIGFYRHTTWWQLQTVSTQSVIIASYWEGRERLVFLL